MKRFIFLVIKKIYYIITDLFDKISNKIIVVSSSIKFESYPIIFGKIQIQNKGTIKLGKNVVFRSETRFNFVGLAKKSSIAVLPNAILTIGDNSGFSGVSLYCSNQILIGEFVNCGGNVSIWDTDFHPLDTLNRRIHNEQFINTAPIIIENDVFIGANSIILKGVTIGNSSIIGAGSVVTKSIPSGEIWAGNPAKFIRKIK